MAIKLNKKYGIHIVDSKGTIHARNLPDRRMATRLKIDIEIAREGLIL